MLTSNYAKQVDFSQQRQRLHIWFEQERKWIVDIENIIENPSISDYTVNIIIRSVIHPTENYIISLLTMYFLGRTFCRLYQKLEYAEN